MIYIGSDHRGFELKKEVISFFNDLSIEFKDVGPFEYVAGDDYPIYAVDVCKAVLNDENSFGILICDTGIGMEITANRFKRIRAALCRDTFIASRAREHNNANVLVLSTEEITLEEDKNIITTFINTPFSNEERHIRRLNMIDSIV